MVFSVAGNPAVEAKTHDHNPCPDWFEGEVMEVWVAAGRPHRLVWWHNEGKFIESSEAQGDESSMAAESSLPGCDDGVVA